MIIFEKDEISDEITPERCKTCDAVIANKDINPEYSGIISTYSNDSSCTFSCMTKALAHSDDD